MKTPKIKTLSRVQAWRKIKLAFIVYSTGSWSESLALCGLCFAVKSLRRRGDITDRVHDTMRKDIDQMRPPGNPDAYYWRTNCDGAVKRVAAIDQLLKRLKKNVTRRRKS